MHTAMAVFCFKKLQTALRLSLVFKNEREAKKLSIKDVAQGLQIPAKYLTALEEGKFATLPKAKPYRLAYVKSYARILGLPPEICAAEFVEERGLEDISAARHPLTNLKQLPFASWSIFIRNAVIGTASLLVVVYLGWQVRQSFEPPELIVFTPEDGQVVTQAAALVQGQTAKEAVLTVNGQDVVVNNQGRFEIHLDLSEGLNTIAVSAARNQHGRSGKRALILRHIIVKPKVKQEITLRR